MRIFPRFGTVKSLSQKLDLDAQTLPKNVKNKQRGQNFHENDLKGMPAEHHTLSRKCTM